MKFDMKNIHTIFESAKSKNCVPSEHADKEGAKIDATLGSSDLNELFDNICPICGDVFASMKSAAADPKNLKITMTKTQDLGESAHIYIEAVEFATFCEAAELEINEAADAIKATCEEMVPGSQDSELHVVFPSECLNKGNLGSNRFGLDVNNDWAMQLMRGCRRYGISVNSGVEDGEPVTESSYKKAMNEAFFGKKKKKEPDPPEISYSDFMMLKAICAKEIKKYRDVKKLAEFMPYSDLYDGHDEFIELNINSTIYAHGDHYDKLEELTKNCESFASDVNNALKKEFNGNITISYDGGGDTLYFSLSLGTGYVKESAEVPDVVKKAFEHKLKNSNNSTMSLNDLDSWDSPVDDKDKTVDQMSDDELRRKNKDAYYMKKGLPFHESAEAMNESTNTYNGYPYSGKTFRKIPIEYYSRDERVEITKEQKTKFNADFAVVKSVYDEIFNSKFIPWLLGSLKSEDEKKDAVKSLELYNITYFQRRNDIGEFEFQYLVKNPGDKAKEPVAFCVSVKDGKIIKSSGYDI